MKIIRKAPRKIWGLLNLINKIVKKDSERIFIYSNLGFRDNIRSVYDYLVENDYTNEYTITVSINDYKTYNKIDFPRIKFVSNLRGLFSFFKCKYCFYCFGKYPVKPASGQVVFNLWHGMPLKRIGNMTKGNKKTDYNYFTHLLCTSEFFRDIMKKSFNCSDSSIVICGQPRTDIMLTDMPPVRGREIMGQLFGFEKRKYKVILWLPTYRENAAEELDILSEEQLSRLNEMCLKKNHVVIVKLHPLSQLDAECFKKFEAIKIVTTDYLEMLDINFYKLIRFSQCLITDYSSVYFDYMLLDKPIGFAVSDMSKYGSDRGFVFDEPMKYMPGDIIKNGEDFLGFVNDVINHKDNFAAQRRELCKTFNYYNDDGNCKRVLDAAGVKIIGRLY